LPATPQLQALTFNLPSLSLYLKRRVAAYYSLKFI